MEMKLENSATNTERNSKINVSVIIPIYNGSKWINRCFDRILKQTAREYITMEICVCDDSSVDNTYELLEQWQVTFNKEGIPFHVIKNNSGKPKGVGYSKNMAVSLSSGDFLCFQDIDDIMLPNRILSQYVAALNLPQHTIIGSKFIREPENSTVRYTKWANSLTQKQLNIQIYTSNGPTVIMPTWFFHRSVFERVGGFSEEGRGIPEDLIFFYKHLDTGGSVFRVDESLLIYTYHHNATTFSIHADTILAIRMRRLQETVLMDWEKFTIWNAGKQGRKFYKALSLQNQIKVEAFCDVDKNKIGKFYTPYDRVTHTTGRQIKIIHFKDAIPPLVICVKMDLSNGNFEENLKSLRLQEGFDYINFS